jgi:type IV secretion system protein VirB3
MGSPEPMAERSPLFLGLARPPKYLGLPVGYLVMLAMGVVLPFIWTKSLIFFLIGIIAYPILWFVADKEPHFFEVLRISFGTVRSTKNRMHHGGDSFGA